MTDIQRGQWAFLKRQHEDACFEVGEHPDEYDTPFSAGADAMERLALIEKTNNDA